MRLAEFARSLKITQNAVLNAVKEGRIESFTKDKRGYHFEADRAMAEYMENTNRRLSRNQIFDEEPEGDDDNGSDEKSVLDINPKKWNANQAVQAKTIYQALKVKHELEVQEGKYYLKTDADKEFLRMSQAFARGLLSLPVKMKQRHPDLTDAQLNDLRVLCKELIEETESKL